MSCGQRWEADGRSLHQIFVWDFKTLPRIVMASVVQKAFNCTFYQNTIEIIIITIKLDILTRLLGERGCLLLLECVEEHELVTDADCVDLGDGLHCYSEVW